MGWPMSPSAINPYGFARACRVWEISSATAFRHGSSIDASLPLDSKRGLRNTVSDEWVLKGIRPAPNLWARVMGVGWFPRQT